MIQVAEQIERGAVVGPALQAERPCPTAGSIQAGSRISVMASPSPSRSSPAWARMRASRPCSASFRSRVSTLPRISVSARSGRRCSTWARRRRLLVATVAPEGRLSKLR